MRIFSLVSTAVLISFVSHGAAQAQEVHDWSGPYVGAQIGYSDNRYDWSEIGTGTNIGDDYFADPTQGDLLGGLHVGYNLQSGALVYGVEADFDIGTSRYHYTHLDQQWGFNGKVGPQGSVRLRTGYATGKMLLYGTGGLAVADTSFSNFCDWCVPTSVSDEMSSTRLGWTLGIGMQYAVSPKLSVRTEYRHSDFGRKSYDMTSYWGDTPGVSGYIDNLNIQTNSIRLGITYAFK